MSKSILEEAMADAKLLKETAIQNAQNVLVEAISPKIREFVDTQLGEADLDENMYETEEEPEMELDLEMPPEEDESQEEALWTESDDEDEDDVKCEGEEEEDLEETVEITQEDLRRAFNEMVRGEISEASVSSNFADVQDATLKVSGGKQQTGIADEKGGEHHWKDEEAPASEDWTVEALHKAYRKKIFEALQVIKSLKTENREYKKATSFLKRNLQEVNLFNSKLLYTNKLLQGVNLNNKQRVSVIEAFDRAQSLREVEMTFKNISESLKIAGVLGEARTKRPKSSRYARSSGTSKVLEESVNNESGEESWADKMTRMAGLDID